MSRGRFALGATVGAVAGLVGTELVLVTRREFLPLDPGYAVDELIPSPSGDVDVPIRLAVLGDSTVAGVGSPTAAESLPALIAQRVAAGTARAVRVTGHGVSGARTAAAAQQLARVEGNVDAIVVVVGANDATHATPWPRFRCDLESLLAAAAARAPVTVLAGTPRFHRNPIIPEPLRTFVDRYSGLLRHQQRAAARATDGVRFVDLAAEASPRFLGVPEATSVDGFHPSPIGYGFWADALAPSVVAGLTAGG
ncbi:MAG: SGNH/GDSL hydrolase family protein [Candidatus Limnocylindria bacterium]